MVAGRGLTLVDALADRWGTERNEVGTTAWFVLRPGRLGGLRADRLSGPSRRPPDRRPDTRARRTDFRVCAGPDLRFLGLCDPGLKEFSSSLAKPDLPAYGYHYI